MKTIREVLVSDRGTVLFMRVPTKVETALGDLIDKETDAGRLDELRGVLKTFQDGLDTNEYDLKALAHAVPQDVRRRVKEEFVLTEIVQTVTESASPVDRA